MCRSSHYFLLFMTTVWGACNISLQGATTVDGFCAQSMSSVTFPVRGMHVVEDGVLVVDKSSQQVKLLVDNDGDGLADQTFGIAQAQGLNHAVIVHGDYLYASSSNTVYRWPYQSGQRSMSMTPAQVVITGITENQDGGTGGHATRTMAFDKQHRLYISVGSDQNIDRGSYRARIRRFTIPDQIPTTGIAFSTGEVYIDGLRNEVGLAFDRHDVLWGVENSADNLVRQDLGGDIHNDNPAEELNRFPECCAGKHYGYPYCFTEYNIPRYGKGKGSVWTWPTFMPQYNDSWCRATTVPPALTLPPHTAPLGMTFFNASKVLPEDCTGGFPAWMDGDAFIGLHGSWNRNPPIGYKVLRVPMSLSGFPRGEALNFFCHSGPGPQWTSGLRPVDVKFDRCNRLLISSDGTTDPFTRTSQGGGVVLVKWDCVECGAGKTGPQCCSTRATNNNKQLAPPAGVSCPGCLASKPPFDSADGVWRSTCSCQDDYFPTQQPSPGKTAKAGKAKAPKGGKKAMKAGKQAAQSG